MMTRTLAQLVPTQAQTQQLRRASGGREGVVEGAGKLARSVRLLFSTNLTVLERESTAPSFSSTSIMATTSTSLDNYDAAESA
jgi:hypothetical protein